MYLKHFFLEILMNLSSFMGETKDGNRKKNFRRLVFHFRNKYFLNIFIKN
jgi:hypothetical protein